MLSKNHNLEEQPTVSIDYLDNTFTKADMDEIKSVLKEANLLLSYRTHSPRFTAGIEDFFANVSISLSPDIIQMISLGIVTNIISAALIKFCTTIYNKIKGKKIKRYKEELLLMNF